MVPADHTAWRTVADRNSKGLGARILGDIDFPTRVSSHDLRTRRIQRSAKVDAPGFVNAAGQLRQKW